MTRNEALEVLKKLWQSKEPECSEKEIRTALDMAIEALERKRGTWIQHDNEPNLWSCSVCETVIYSEHEEDRLKFHKWCGCCGAYMTGGDHD